MDYVYFSVMAGTVFVILAYVYFYFLYRERYMGLWLISWLFFFSRILLFDYGPFDWTHSILGFTLYQISFIICALLFLWGIQTFINRPLSKNWLYSALICFSISTTFNLLSLPLLYKLLLPAWFGGIVLLYIGRAFMRDIQINGVGNYITGYSFMSWGFLTIIMPVTINLPWLSPWCYLMGGVARLFISLGILLVYFEKTRSDLMRKENQYRLLAENALDVIYRYRIFPEAKFEYISPAAFPVTGYAPEEFYADSNLLFKLVHPEDLAEFNMLTEIPKGTDGLLYTFRIKRKDQMEVWIEQKCAPIYDANHNIIALEGILRDVTARKNLEQVMFRSEKMNMVGQMAVSVAHEIRNPLTSVRGYLQIMRGKQENSINISRYDLMIEELDRTNKIISEYLLLAKDKVPVLKRCCLNEIIMMLHPLLEASAIGFNVDIKLALQEIPKLDLDEYEIRQLLLNLVNNAFDAMTSGGELHIRTYVEQDKAVLSITDQGPGIPAHILSNLGTPFLTTKDTGTGLGLPVCYRITNRHHAIIDVQTNNQGTTFNILFSLPTTI